MSILSSILYYVPLKTSSSSATPIVDNDGRVIAVLAGRPSDAGWEELQRRAASKLKDCRHGCRFSGKLAENRRGGFPALAIGVSFGGGQRRPQNLVNGRANQKVLEYLNSQAEFKRIAGFGSSRFLF